MIVSAQCDFDEETVDLSKEVARNHAIHSIKGKLIFALEMCFVLSSVNIVIFQIRCW